ncbi:MAG: hypothetical protein ACK5PD_11485 [Pirellulaceae bacterium]
MGIRFACHACKRSLHLKDFQAGKRGKCPDCGVRFRIPSVDQPFSTPLDDAPETAESPQATNPQSQAPEVPSESANNSNNAAAQRKSSSGEPSSEAPRQRRRKSSVPPAVIDVEYELVDSTATSEGGSNSSSRQRPKNNRDEGWFWISPNGPQRIGSLDSGRVEKWIREGRLRRDHLVRQGDQKEEILAGDAFQAIFERIQNASKLPQRPPLLRLPVEGEKPKGRDADSKHRQRLSRVAQGTPGSSSKENPITPAEPSSIEKRLQSKRASKQIARQWINILLAMAAIALTIALLAILWWQSQNAGG